MTNPTNNSQAQINYRNAKAESDRAEDLMMEADCTNPAEMAAAEAAFDAACAAEEAAGTALIQWLRGVMVEQSAPAEAMVAINAALSGDRRFRSRIIDLAESLAA